MCQPSFELIGRLKVSDSMQVSNLKHLNSIYWRKAKHLCSNRGNCRRLVRYCNVSPSAVPIAQQKDSGMHLTEGFLHVCMALRGTPVLTMQTIWLCRSHSNPWCLFLSLSPVVANSFLVPNVLLLVSSLCLVAMFFQGANYHCEPFISIQILYLVGVLLMTFDLLTCGHSQGNGCPPVYISKVTNQSTQ